MTTRLRHGELRLPTGMSPYIETGDHAASQAVVYVHGNPGSSRDWEQLLKRTGEFARSIAIDLPRYGAAEASPAFEYSVGGYANHLASALDRLQVETAHLVLHDFGGPFGLAWAISHPRSVGSVVLIDSGVLPGYRWHYAARLWRTPIVGELSQLLMTRPVFGLMMTRDNPKPLPSQFVDLLYRNLKRMGRRVPELYRSTDLALSALLVPQLRQLELPALVIWGGRDPYLPPSFAERQRDAFPKARVVVLDESGHWPFIDDAPAVAAELVNFLEPQFDAKGGLAKAGST